MENYFKSAGFLRLLSVHKLTFEEERKRLFFILTNLLAILLLLGLAVSHYFSEMYRHAIVNIIFSGISVAIIIFSRKYKDGLNYYRFATLIGSVLCIYVATQGENHGYKILWFYVMPGIVFFLLGKTEGFFISLAMLFCLLLLIALPQELTGAARYEPAFHVRFIATFLIILAISWSSENMRESYKVQLQNKNLSLESDKKIISEAERKMRELAHNDELTGISNRRAVLNVLELKIKNATKDSTLAIGLLDIDNFKAINDSYGHQVGDSVIQEVALRIRKTIRKNDIVGRYGGEEFLVLIDNPGKNNAFLVFEKIREIISNTVISTNSGNIKVTASIGVSVFDEKHTSSDLIKIADQALYQAKAAGRNKTVLSNC